MHALADGYVETTLWSKFCGSRGQLRAPAIDALQRQRAVVRAVRLQERGSARAIAAAVSSWLMRNRCRI